jgi:hypothetical protein
LVGIGTRQVSRVEVPIIFLSKRRVTAGAESSSGGKRIPSGTRRGGPVRSRQGLEWFAPQPVVPKPARRDFTPLNRKAGEGPLKNMLSEKPLWKALYRLLRKRTLSQLDTFFKLILFFSNNPLQFGKTWFISSSLFLLAFSRCSGYNRSLKGRRESGI